MSLNHLFYDGWEWSHMATFIRFDPLADEVHHFLAAQHIPTHTDTHKQAMMDQWYKYFHTEISASMWDFIMQVDPCFLGIWAFSYCQQ